MHMHHGHDHASCPDLANRNAARAFAIGVVLNTAFVVIEFTFGVMAGSLSLVADAGHNLSDVLGLLLAWGANWLSQRKPSGRRTYGFGRTSILAALANAILLLIAVGAIAWEAVLRLRQPENVSSATMIWVAGIGVVINTVTALLFISGRKDDLNIRGAFLHMAADAAVSLGVVIAGVVIGFTNILWIDPALSLLIAAVIAVSTWYLLWQSLNLALDSVPQHVDLVLVREYLAALPGVTAVHDLHIWALSTTETALTVHLVKPEAAVDDDWLDQIGHELHERFGIVHPTIQIESGRG